MLTPDDFARRLDAIWGGKTAADLCAQAARQSTGMAWSALADDTGRRYVLAAAFTDPQWIAAAEAWFGLDASAPGEDLKQFGIVFMVWKSVGDQALVCVRETTPPGTAGPATALVLIAAEPVSITSLEQLFGLRA